MSDLQLSLSEYLSIVQETIKQTFSDAIWVKAEIRNLNIKSGHNYLELAEKDEDTDKVIASCKATIWKSSAAKMILKFEKESGIELTTDLNILIKIKAAFSPQYGFSVNIEDIDSSYTLGDIAKRYQQILLRLSQEELVHKNRLLPTPFDLHHILVIAPENAAGLGDFRKDADLLAKSNVCQFTYHTATFQGNTAAKSISESLANALRQWAKATHIAPDLIVIIRGGGAVNDLAYLNDYDLAALLCKRSVPIWVGIGHEKDKTILDEVAHRSFDTPSKVIAGIRNLISERSQQVLEYLQTIKFFSQNQITIYQKQNEQHIQLIKTLAQNQLNESNKNINLIKNTTQYFAQLQVKNTTTLLDSLMRETLLQNPKTVMAKGYAVVRNQGKTIRSVQQIVDKSIQIEIQDGIINAHITQVSKND